jgi:hypothetical protein
MIGDVDPVAAGAGALDLAEELVAAIAADRAKRPGRHVVDLDLLAARGV